MAISAEMRCLKNKWGTGTAWPKRLEWLEIHGLRGWTGQRIDFGFPMVALVGENGSGKSTILQASAAVYRNPDKDKRKEWYASDFFPDTPFERIEKATIRFSYRQGSQSQTQTVRKPTGRWRGNPERPERRVEYIDLSRIQPVGARVGYAKLLKKGVSEDRHDAFDGGALERFSEIMGRQYTQAGISRTNVDIKRPVPVVEYEQHRYSGFHQGAGEIAAAELLAAGFPNYGLIVIDEIETSLHPRAQRRLVRDLARLCREKELQIILTTHSPYILEELPQEGRIYLMDSAGGKSVVTGVSPDFAMTKMDEEQHPECDVYVEDQRAATLVIESVIAKNRDLRQRISLVPYGSASVGMALGKMLAERRFPRPAVVFIDGDQSPGPGCIVLPGNDSPERVVFDSLRARNWPEIAQRIGRTPSETIDALNRSTTLTDHHEWARNAADRLTLGSDHLWQVACASWAKNCASSNDLESVAQPISDALDSISEV